MNAALLVMMLAPAQCWGVTPPLAVAGEPVAAPMTPPLEWVHIGDNELALYRGAFPVGHYDFRSGAYRPVVDLERKKLGEPCPPPIALPAAWVKTAKKDADKPKESDKPQLSKLPPPNAQAAQTAPDGVVNYGINTERLNNQPAYICNGAPCSRDYAFGILEKSLPDDAGNWHLTITHKSREDADKLKAEIMASPAMAELLPKLHVQAYAKDDAMLACGFVTGAPCIQLEAPDGAVLHRQDHFDGGPVALAEAVRKARSDYDPKRDPDLTKPGTPGGVPPAGLWAGLAALLLFLFGKKPVKAAS